MSTNATRNIPRNTTRGPTQTDSQGGTDKPTTWDADAEREYLEDLFWTLYPHMTGKTDHSRSRYPSDSSRLLESIDSKFGELLKATTVLPSEAGLKGNEGRQVSEKGGFNIIMGKKFDDDTWTKKALTALAVPTAFEVSKIPLGTYKDAYSTVHNFLQDDAGIHAKSWWDSASGLASRGSEWISGAASDASKAIFSTDSNVLLGLGLAGVGLAAAGYGAYSWYNQSTASDKSEETTKEGSAEQVSSARTTRQQGLNKLRSMASQVKVPRVSSRVM